MKNLKVKNYVENLLATMSVNEILQNNNMQATFILSLRAGDFFYLYSQ